MIGEWRTQTKEATAQPLRHFIRLASASSAAPQTRHSLHQKTLCAVELHNVQPVFRTGFLFHAVKMVLYGLLGK